MNPKTTDQHMKKKTIPPEYRNWVSVVIFYIYM